MAADTPGTISNRTPALAHARPPGGAVLNRNGSPANSRTASWPALAALISSLRCPGPASAASATAASAGQQVRQPVGHLGPRPPGRPGPAARRPARVSSPSSPGPTPTKATSPAAAVRAGLAASSAPASLRGLRLRRSGVGFTTASSPLLVGVRRTRPCTFPHHGGAVRARPAGRCGRPPLAGPPALAAHRRAPVGRRRRPRRSRSCVRPGSIRADRARAPGLQARRAGCAPRSPRRAAGRVVDRPSSSARSGSASPALDGQRALARARASFRPARRPRLTTSMLADPGQSGVGEHDRVELARRSTLASRVPALPRIGTGRGVGPQQPELGGPARRPGADPRAGAADRPAWHRPGPPARPAGHPGPARRPGRARARSPVGQVLERVHGEVDRRRPAGARAAR